jgi:hypothetical protein
VLIFFLCSTALIPCYSPASPLSLCHVQYVPPLIFCSCTVLPCYLVIVQYRPNILFSCSMYSTVLTSCCCAVPPSTVEILEKRRRFLAGTVYTFLCVAEVKQFTLYLFSAQCIKIGGGHAQFFFESAISIPQLEGSTSAIAIPQLEGSTSAIAIPQLFKEMLLRNRNSVIPQSQFFPKSATSSPQPGSFNSANFGTFLAVESGRFMGKKSEVKNIVLLSL